MPGTVLRAAARPVAMIVPSSGAMIVRMEPRRRASGRRIGALALTALLLAAAPGHAQDAPADPLAADPLAADPLAEVEQAMRHVMTALQLLLATVPQYAMPEVLDNGDIVIRRVQPEAPPDPQDVNDDGIDETTI